jgi:hypothetical protein
MSFLPLGLLFLSHPCSLTFRWLAIPFFQTELDEYVLVHNTTQRRANKHKVLPHGIPEQMFRFPKSVDAKDFKVDFIHPLLTRSSPLNRLLFLTVSLLKPRIGGPPKMTLFLSLCHLLSRKLWIGATMN